MKFDRYNLTARILPAILASLPFFVLYYFFLSVYIRNLFVLILKFEWIGDVTTAVAFLILLAFLGRTISKDIFERKWFKSDETYMPTTEFLLPGNTEYTISFKQRIFDKMKKDFSVDLGGIVDDGQEARKTVAEIVSMVRDRVGNGRLLLERNIEYGFIRNFIGCSVVSIFVSILNLSIFIWIDKNETATVVSLALLLFYASPILFSKLLLKTHGKRYARTLFQEYLSR